MGVHVTKKKLTHISVYANENWCIGAYAEAEDKVQVKINIDHPRNQDEGLRLELSPKGAEMLSAQLLKAIDEARRLQAEWDEVEDRLAKEKASEPYVDM